MSKEKIIMPRELTAENGAKALLMGEFYQTVIMPCTDCDGEGYFDGDPCIECDGAAEYTLKVPISWTTIKAIYKMAAENLGEEIK